MPSQTRTMSAESSPLPALVSEFDALQRRICAYERALAVIEYDDQTVAPPSSASVSGEASSALFAAVHQMRTSPETGELLSALSEHAGELDELHAAELRMFGRSYEEERRLPAELVADYRHLVAEAFPAWRAAKHAGDFAAFAPYLERVFRLLREQSACLDPDADPYDVQLGRQQRGVSQAVCDGFFSQVREVVSPLVREIVARDAAQGGPRDFAFSHARMPAAEQEALARDLAGVLGLDPARLTLGLTEHPSSYDLGREDVRIAHHYIEDDVLDGVATSCHEGGHALYMQNVDPKYSGTCLHGGLDSGIHESQSRLMENNVCRSRPFMETLLPLLRRHAPEAYAGVGPDELYRACNVVRPGPIRTQADELTYPLHIMVRYECEKLLMAGELPVAEVPALWNRLMREHLGVEVADDASGCLQDMHWASDFVGYFPGYALGNAYAAQFMACARADYAGDMDERIAAGDLSPVTGWLKEHVWRHGRSLDPDELIESACGGPFDPAHYLSYLQEKYRGLYGV